MIVTNTVFSQSKKEQNDVLNKRVDSLNQILNFERNVNVEKINILNSNILNLQSQITSLNLKIENLKKELENSEAKVSSKNTELQQTQIELEKQKNNFKIRMDSLSLVLEQIYKLNQSSNSSYEKWNQYKTIDDLIMHFNHNEIIGEKNSKSFAFIGAIDGCSYITREISIEIYKFREPDRIWENLPYKNGNFGMLIHSPTEGSLNKKIISIFNSF